MNVWGSYFRSSFTPRREWQRGFGTRAWGCFDFEPCWVPYSGSLFDSILYSRSDSKLFEYQAHFQISDLVFDLRWTLTIFTRFGRSKRWIGRLEGMRLGDSLRISPNRSNPSYTSINGGLKFYTRCGILFLLLLHYIRIFKSLILYIYFISWWSTLSW